MSAIVKLRLRVFRNFQQFMSLRPISNYPTSFSKNAEIQKVEGEEEFRSLDLSPNKSLNVRSYGRKLYKRVVIPPPRSHKMPVDQDWTSVWPVLRTFHPASVPLPLHQGWVNPGGTPPGKFANAELMKIPNFLHLTPPTIERQCKALKKFCTEWPKELNTTEKIDHHFPIKIITRDYLHSSPSLRDARARIVTLQLKLSALKLDSQAKDKLLRLVKERYNPETDVLTIVSERCPLRKQNLDYAMYLLNVLVSESRKTEPWENEKCEADMEKYVWEGSQSQRTLDQLLKRMPDREKAQDLSEFIELYSRNVTHFHNEGEDAEKVNAYKESVEKLLGLNA